MLFVSYNKLRNVQTLNLVNLFYFLTVNLPEHSDLISGKCPVSLFLNCAYVHWHSIWRMNSMFGLTVCGRAGTHTNTSRETLALVNFN